MKDFCPHCSSSQIFRLDQLEATDSCKSSCAVHVQELFLSEAVASLRPPARRNTGIRILAFFLASIFLAWPIDLLLTRHMIVSHPIATVVAFHSLPLPAEGQPGNPQTDTARHTEEVLASVPNLTIILLLLACSLALALLLAINLHQARQFNQAVWGPAVERWNNARYCIACAHVFTVQDSEIDNKAETRFPAVPANPSAA